MFTHKNMFNSCRPVYCTVQVLNVIKAPAKGFDLIISKIPPHNLIIPLWTPYYIPDHPKKHDRSTNHQILQQILQCLYQRYFMDPTDKWLWQQLQNWHKILLTVSSTLRFCWCSKCHNKRTSVRNPHYFYISHCRKLFFYTNYMWGE